MPTPTEKEYAGFRAHQDMKDTNALAKAAAQAALLINGGAASAMLAFMSNKDNATRVSSTVAYSLSGYALGVFLGAAAFLTLTFCLEQTSTYWENERFGISSKENSKRADRWATASTVCCVTALGCFVCSSLLLAITIHRSF